MHSLIKMAIESRARHFRLGWPITGNREGFKEANVAHDISHAFQNSGYYVFPEFPFEGSIDAVFIRDLEVVVSEWKCCWKDSSEKIIEQTARMLRFDPTVELPKHGFEPEDWVTRRLWVCDAWDQRSIDWWLGRPVAGWPACPFGDWSVGGQSFPGLKWELYAWLWAYK